MKSTVLWKRDPVAEDGRPQLTVTALQIAQIGKRKTSHLVTGTQQGSLEFLPLFPVRLLNGLPWLRTSLGPHFSDSFRFQPLSRFRASAAESSNVTAHPSLNFTLATYVLLEWMTWSWVIPLECSKSSLPKFASLPSQLGLAYRPYYLIETFVRISSSIFPASRDRG